MNPIRSILAVVVLLLACAALQAQVLELGMSAGANRLSNSELAREGNIVAKLDSGFRIGFRVTLNAHEYFGHEVGYAYNRTNLNYGGTSYGMGTHQGLYNLLLYARPEGSRVRPFISGGAQFNNYVFPGLSVTSGGGTTKFGVNYGAGIKVRTSDRFLMRLDFHQYLSPKPDWFLEPPKGWLRMNEVSVGFAYTL